LSVFGDLIERMYAVAANTDGLRAATNNFVQAIQGQTEELSHQLTDLFSNSARLSAPTEMSKLFRALDFSHRDENHSVLKQKGDGIKVRHLPELLRFINQNETAKRFFIWGFEEPENSLDLGAAQAEAKRFKEFSDRHDTQIFITSHSPVFYMNNDKSGSVKKYFIEKQHSVQEGDSSIVDPSDAASEINNIEDAEKLMDKSGLLQLPFIIRKISEVSKLNDEIYDQKRFLEEKISEISKPILFVEGVTDKKVFEKCFAFQGIGDRVTVEVLSGTPKTAGAFLKIISDCKMPIGGNRILFLFDNDFDGRAAIRGLTRLNVHHDPIEIEKNFFAWTLPTNDIFDDFRRKFCIDENVMIYNMEFCAEEIFIIDFIDKIFDSKRYKELNFRPKKKTVAEWSEKIHDKYFKSLSQSQVMRLHAAKTNSLDWIYCRGVHGDFKAYFSENVCETISKHKHIHIIAEKCASLLLKE